MVVVHFNSRPILLLHSQVAIRVSVKARMQNQEKLHGHRNMNRQLQLVLSPSPAQKQYMNLITMTTPTNHATRKWEDAGTLPALADPHRL